MESVDPDSFGDQMKVLLEDIIPDSIKISMLPGIEFVDIIYSYYKKYRLKNIVIDPVMISKHNNVLTPKKILKYMSVKLFPVSQLITPNINEASFLTDMEIKDVDDMINACKKLYDCGARNVLLKGGHLKGDRCIDILFDGRNIYRFENKRVETIHTHGSGCVLSSSIAANMSTGRDIYNSVSSAIKFVNKAIKNSFPLGRGVGSLGVF